VKHFQAREVREAMAYAMAGGQALHVHRFTAPASAPPAFRREPNQEMAHLFDQDENRLRATALGLGLTVVRVHHRATHRQHVDLTGEWLERARAICEREGNKTATIRQHR
jgi:hypothetical protein